MVKQKQISKRDNKYEKMLRWQKKKFLVSVGMHGRRHSLKKTKS